MRTVLADLVRDPTPFLFFTGKGGVGKTSLACATAVALADAGKRVLLVSTDPASNLDEVLGQKLGNTPVPIPDVPRLSALNFDPQAAAGGHNEDRCIKEVAAGLSRRTALVPWLKEEPVGPARLGGLFGPTVLPRNS